MRILMALFVSLALVVSTAAFSAQVSITEFKDDLMDKGIELDGEKYQECTAVAELLVSYYPWIYNSKVDKTPPPEEWAKRYERSTLFLYERLEADIFRQSSRELFDHLLKLMKERFSLRQDGVFKSDIRTVSFVGILSRIDDRCTFVLSQEPGLSDARKALLSEVAATAKKMVEELTSLENGSIKRGVRVR